MGEGSLSRFKFDKTQVSLWLAHAHNFFQRHTALSLFGGVLGIGLFGMPLLSGAANSYVWSTEEQPTQNISSAQALQEETQLRVEASAKSTSTNSLTSGSTSVSATTNAANPQDSVDVMVNGQTVPVSQNGSVQKHFVSKDGKTVVDVQVDGGGSAHSHSSTSIEINSQTFSSGSETNDAKGRHPNRR